MFPLALYLPISTTIPIWLSFLAWHTRSPTCTDHLQLITPERLASVEIYPRMIAINDARDERNGSIILDSY